MNMNILYALTINTNDIQLFCYFFVNGFQFYTINVDTIFKKYAKMVMDT